MKNILSASALSLLTASFATAQDIDCFTLDDLSVKAGVTTVDNPLPGSGSLQGGTIGGSFGNSGPDGLSGSFSINVFWNANDDIPWTVSGNTIQFASGGQDLAFGNLDVEINDFDNDLIKKVEFTVSVCLDEEGLELVQEAFERAGEGAQLFLVSAEGERVAESKFDGGRDAAINLSELDLLTDFNADEKGDVKGELGRDGLQGVPEGFSYAVFNADGQRITEDPINFDTHLGFEVCACVPEPSTASLSLLALGALVTRRKR